MSKPISPEELQREGVRLASATAIEALAWAESRFGDGAVIASSFAVEDVVLIDLAAKHAPSLSGYAGTITSDRLTAKRVKPLTP